MRTNKHNIHHSKVFHYSKILAPPCETEERYIFKKIAATFLSSNRVKVPLYVKHTSKQSFGAENIHFTVWISWCSAQSIPGSCRFIFLHHCRQKLKIIIKKKACQMATCRTLFILLSAFRYKEFYFMVLFLESPHAVLVQTTAHY